MQKSLLSYQLLIYFCLFSIRPAVFFEIFSNYCSFHLNQSTIFFSFFFLRKIYFISGLICSSVLSRMQNMFNYRRRNEVLNKNISQVTVIFVYELSRWGNKKRKPSPRRGIEPRSPAWQAGILTTILPRIWDKSMIALFKMSKIASVC